MFLSHIKPGELYDAHKYLAQTSDILAHLLHEHQVGFVNRIINVLCLARDGGIPPAQTAAVSTGNVQPTANQNTLPKMPTLEEAERDLVRYVLFANEAAFPQGGIAGDAQYMKDFVRNKKPAKTGASLKDFDLHTRMFKNRCSYMIYTAQWQALPENVKTSIYTMMKAALSGHDPEFAYIPPAERGSIVAIMRDTVPDLPADWR